MMTFISACYLSFITANDGLNASFVHSDKEGFS